LQPTLLFDDAPCHVGRPLPSLLTFTGQARALDARGIRIGNMPQERLIRKYSNRRLYDTGASRHVTLEDLRQLVVSGERIKVVDDKTGEDLTRSVLLQIIAEQEQFGAPVLGCDLLEMIIRFYGGPMQALLSRYLEQAFTGMLTPRAGDA
jgi:polyhydroxyalkanoate synthesis repressor PhaR